jgi:hypothetical protein
MADEIPNLWGDDIDLSVLTPLMILNAQVANLNQRTQGIIRGELAASQTQEVVTLDFDIVAVSAYNVRKRILRVRYKADQVYPALLASVGVGELEGRIPAAADLSFGDLHGTYQTMAPTQAEFIEYLGGVLKSTFVRQLMESVIGMSNERKSGLNVYIHRLGELSRSDGSPNS